MIHAFFYFIQLKSISEMDIVVWIEFFGLVEIHKILVLFKLGFQIPQVDLDFEASDLDQNPKSTYIFHLYFLPLHIFCIYMEQPALPHD